MMRDDNSVSVRTLSVLVDHTPGILARVVGLFSGRGYNISSLTVSAVSEDRRTARMTITTRSSDSVVRQIRAQLFRLVQVRAVANLSEEGSAVEKELVLVKLVATGAERREALRLADIFKAQVSDTTFESFIFTMVGSPPKVASFVSLMSRLGKVELARSGSVALSRGMALLEEGEGVNPCRVAS